MIEYQKPFARKANFTVHQSIYTAPLPNSASFVINGGTIYEGNGTLSGVAKINGTIQPNIVLECYSERSQNLVSKTVSDVDGNFIFNGLNVNELFFIVAKDPNGLWEYRISSRRVPVTTLYGSSGNSSVVASVSSEATDFYDPLGQYVVSKIYFDGADGNTAYFDQKNNLNNLASYGGANVQSGSLYFPNTNTSTPTAYIQQGFPETFDAPTLPFCLEFNFLAREQATYWPTGLTDKSHCMISMDGNGTNLANNFMTYNQGAGVKLRYVRESAINSSAVDLNSTTELALNQFHHVALTWDGTNMILWVNGVADATQASSTGFVKGNSGPFLFGRSYNPSYPTQAMYLIGSIRNFRFTLGNPRYTATFTPDF